MSYTLDPKSRYRMPSHFGPSPGPRNVPSRISIDHTKYPLTTAVTLRFLTDADALNAMLPPGFELAGDPIVSIDFAYMKQIQWLAGRGYNICLLSWPAVFKGEKDTVTGRFAAVLFENFADPIITGRDELGHPKIYCEIPEPTVLDDVWTCQLSWDGYEFLNVSVEDLGDEKPATEFVQTDGWIQYKYIPGTPPEAGPDCAYATQSPDPLDPDVHANMTIDQRRWGRGQVAFREAQWEDMPTVHHVANAFAALPVHEVLMAAVTHVTGWIGDVGDTKKLG